MFKKIFNKKRSKENYQHLPNEQKLEEEINQQVLFPSIQHIKQIHSGLDDPFKNLVFSYLEDDDSALRKLALLCSEFQTLAQPELNQRAWNIFRSVSSSVALGNQDKAEKILKLKPYLLLKKSVVAGWQVTMGKPNYL